MEKTGIGVTRQYSQLGTAGTKEKAEKTESPFFLVTRELSSCSNVVKVARDLKSYFEAV